MAVKGLSLLSGGLDSCLAVCVLREQGIEMEGVVFASPFFNSQEAEAAAARLGIKLHVLDFTEDIFNLIRHPPHGFGSAMNPCIDCHARMIWRAAEFMRQGGYDFVATGEVLNQRPMSQNRRSLDVVEKDSGLAGYLVRPLSAKLLPPTIPEQDGRIDREKLLDLSGRTRKPQIALAVHFGLKEYPSPAGGCLLTEKGFCNKLADWLDHGGALCKDAVAKLKFARHFRLPEGGRCIVGRNRTDNQALKAAVGAGDTLVHSVNVPGPTALILGAITPGDLARVAGIVANYSDKGDRAEIIVRTTTDAGAVESSVTPLPRETFTPWML